MSAVNVQFSAVSRKAHNGNPNVSHSFREKHREQLKHRLDGRLYALSVLGGLVLAMGVLAYAIQTYHGYFWVLLPAYFLFCNLIEYLLHRYPMHHRTKGFEVVYEHVTIHHNFYADKFFYFEIPIDYYAAILPAYILVGLSAVIFAVAGIVYLASDLSNALFFALVAYGYYLTYEVLHFSFHASETSWVKKLPFMKQLARQHILHHQTHLMTHCNFNITVPIFDWIFQTMHQDSGEAQGAGESGGPLPKPCKAEFVPFGYENSTSGLGNQRNESA